ncbi:hypothetical protein FC90_GL000132 [Latilactobacillus graminis DSM 20719]|uniref:Uncharacterized protein n=1 Tax=Latilactobacillus graminis DSM 20719 TaxID=1423752 RepID=A0AA89I393_9LACO|nr:hypothetical protein FC90_GL000132 [Latilactobacillus graminis DSM 20719]
MEINQERQIAVQVKQMFKDIREIEIKDVHYNSSTGYTHANVNVCQNDGATFFVNITLGEPKTFVGGTEAMRQQGKTEQEIEVFYKNRESERIK